MKSIIFKSDSNEYKTIEGTLNKIAESAYIKNVEEVRIEACADKAILKFRLAGELSPANPWANIPSNSEKDKRVVRPADKTDALKQDLEIREQINEDYSNGFEDPDIGKDILNKGPLKQASEDGVPMFKTVVIKILMKDAVPLSEIYNEEEDDYFIDESKNTDFYKEQFLTQLKEDLDYLIDIDTMDANCLVDYKINDVIDKGNTFSVDTGSNNDILFKAYVDMILDIPINSGIDIKQAIDEECENIKEILRNKYDISVVDVGNIR